MMSWRQPASNTKPQFVKSMRRPAALGRALGLRREPGDACLAHPASIARPMAGHRGLQIDATRTLVVDISSVAHASSRRLVREHLAGRR